jgi:RNA polymerase sigma factor (sigma-70 family)
VIRFQDMAFACAYAVLGDAYLAEDTAQEAFVVAWQKLSQLRDPAAFPGWFKRIVLSQCNRLTRASRLPIVPLEAGIDTLTRDPGPHLAAERHDLLSKVLQAIKALPENERLVTTLFYVNGYTQADIGEFLEVPVSTVNKRLYSARQRLKELAVEFFKDDLHRQRPSRDSDFSNRVQTKLRPLTDLDWPPVTAIASARAHGDRPGQELWLNRRQHFDESRYFRRQYVAEDARTKQIIAYGSIEQTIYLPKYRLFLLTDPRWLKRGVGDLLLDQLTNDLVEGNAVTVSCQEYASETELLAFLRNHGFEETASVLDLRLNVSKSDLSAFLPTLKQVQELGISITTLAQERARDPYCVQKLYELETLLRQDDPARGPIAPPRYNAREALLWLEMPYVLPDAYFIARRGKSYLGVTDVSLFEAFPGSLRQGFTGVRREYRRQGVATALKIQAALYAQSNGYQVIQALNKPAQSAILSLNKKLGFELLYQYVTMEKCLKKVIALDALPYDEFAGHYQDDNYPDLDLTVRNEAGRLTVECVGQKVELFPASETSFFVKQFYGEATFLRDERGEFRFLTFHSRGLSPESAQTLHAKKLAEV